MHPDELVADLLAGIEAAGISVVVLEDSRDARLVDFSDLTDVELRSAREPAAGMFLAEGEKTIRRAIAAGYVLRRVLTSPRWLASLTPAIVVAAGADAATLFVGADDVVASVTGFVVHRGALASFDRRQLPDVTRIASEASSLVILEDLTDHTNVGLVFRSAAALGVTGAVLSPRCADPLYRRAIRTSMGAVLTLPYARMTNWYAGLEDVRAAGHRLLALTPDATATPLDEAVREAGARVALILGAEGDGVSARWLKGADDRVRIPMAAGVDSLNVAAAAAIAMYVLAREAS